MREETFEKLKSLHRMPGVEGESWALRWEERMEREPVRERTFSLGPVFAESMGCSEICPGNRPTRKP